MVAGTLGDEFKGVSPLGETDDDSFITEVPSDKKISCGRPL